ncbi:MAG: 23S rRNA pseudouridine synthase [Bacteroidetes bacterium]|nr:MAG: 23S rRNA pseudouridine synthase [Bacteroidota bacterium]
MPGMSRLYTIVARYFKIPNAEAEKIIGAGRVLVNGRKVPPSEKLEYWDEVSCDGKIIRPGVNFTYIKYYKPAGIESTTGQHIAGNLRSVVSHPAPWQPAGRLDKESEGLMLLTDDGRIARAVSDSRTHREKEYVVTVDRSFDDDFLKQMSAGVTIMGKKTRPVIIARENESPDTFRIILTQGLNRQIRRMCYKLGYNVVRLTRLRIAHITTAGLHPGEWKELAEEERDVLLRMIK